jgi:cyclic pyranopterin phosphate synthase
MLDPYGRPITNIRISVTQRCNLNCFYCHSEGHVKTNENKEVEMTPAEIAKIVETASNMGIRKLKITGGEPLLRKDILEIISGVKPYMDDISLTTNGVLLEDYAKDLSAAGLNRINVSLDTLDKKTYEFLTGRDILHQVMSGITAIHGNGLSPLKLNMVVLKGINEHELTQMMDFTRKVRGILQIIELETTRECIDSEMYSAYHAEMQPIESWLNVNAKQIISRKMHHRKKYRIELGGLKYPLNRKDNDCSNGAAEVEVVKPMHNSEFCSNCTRLRVTADGRLKPCLLSDDHLLDIITPIRQGADKDQLQELFRQTAQLREPYWQ